MLRKRAEYRASPKRMISGVLILIVLLVAIISLVDIKQHILQLLEWLDSHKTLAPLVFILINMLFVIFVLPGVFLTLGAGLLFGLKHGFFYVLLSTTLGSTVSFVIGRYSFGKKTLDYLACHPRLQLFNKEFACTGWRGVLLLRLIPFFPFKLSNYLFGCARFSLRSFIIGTFLGIIPLTFLNVYVGSLAADLATLGVNKPARPLWLWFVYGLGILVIVAFLFYVSRLAQRVLPQYASIGKGNSRCNDHAVVGS